MRTLRLFCTQMWGLPHGGNAASIVRNYLAAARWQRGGNRAVRASLAQRHGLFSAVFTRLRQSAPRLHHYENTTFLPLLFSGACAATLLFALGCFTVPLSQAATPASPLQSFKKSDNRRH